MDQLRIGDYVRWQTRFEFIFGTIVALTSSRVTIRSADGRMPGGWARRTVPRSQVRLVQKEPHYATR